MFAVGRNWFNPLRLSVECLQSSSDNEYRTRSLIQTNVACSSSSFVPGGSLVAANSRIHKNRRDNLHSGEAIEACITRSL